MIIRPNNQHRIKQIKFCRPVERLHKTFVISTMDFAKITSSYSNPIVLSGLPCLVTDPVFQQSVRTRLCFIQSACKITSLCVAVIIMICATLVNIQTDTHTTNSILPTYMNSSVS